MNPLYISGVSFYHDLRIEEIEVILLQSMVYRISHVLKSIHPEALFNRMIKVENYQSGLMFVKITAG